MAIERDKNPLGILPTGVLLRKFAAPSIVAMLVGSLYNMVDQYFIGQSVGPLGNAATNIAFPLSFACIAIALLCGIGGASAYNIAMGEGDPDRAVNYMGNAATAMVGGGIVLLLIAQIFLKPMLMFFGSPAEVLPYAVAYTRITSLGFPMLILTSGGGHLVRADGRPKISMICSLSGAILNTFLDALFVFGFGWGIEGAAYATIIGQYLSGFMIIWYLAHCQTVALKKENLIIKKQYLLRAISLGTAPSCNQLAMMIVQIVLNNTLKHYGSMSVYGESIPIACVGIISKVNAIFMAFIIGISQGSQPVISFNYGAKKFDRVKRAYLQAAGTDMILAIIAFLMFQIFPRKIIGFFGDGSEEYFRFAINYFRIYLFCTFLNFLQPISSNFFTAIGKPKKGMLLSLTRQVFFLLPLLIALPLFMGIDGVMYAGPVADFAAAATAFFMVRAEFARDDYKKEPRQAEA